MTKTPSIGIIGCGWLGKPLAQRFLRDEFRVFGTTTQTVKVEELEKLGIIADVYNEQVIPPKWLTQLDVCIVNFPPSKSSQYSVQVGQLLENLSLNCLVVFISSTGVYFQQEGWVNEESPIDENQALAFAETTVKNSRQNWFILRLGGLIGPDRHPINSMSGRVIDNGQHPVNLIHQSDVIEAISAIVASGEINQVFNVVHPDHPMKETYYSQKAIDKALELPQFQRGSSAGKSVDGSKIEQRTHFRYTEKL